MTRFTVSAAELNEAAAWVSRVVPARPVVPILSGLLLEAAEDELTIRGYDYDNLLATTISATITEPGTVLLSGRLLAAVAAASTKGARGDQQIAVTADGAAATLREGRSEWQLPLLPAEDYPTLPQLGDPVGHITAGVLREAIARVSVATGKDDTLPMLTGIKLEGTAEQLTLTATDRFRIATTQIPWTFDADKLDLLVPAGLLEHAARAFRDDSNTIAISRGEAGLGFATDRHRIVGRLLDVEFPRWQKLMNYDAEHYAVVEVAELARAVDQALVVVDRVPQVVLAFGAELVEVTGAGDDKKARADAPVVELAGAPMTVALNPAYLRDALATAGSSQVRIHFGAGPNRPLMFFSDDDSFRHLVMPVRLPELAAAA